MDPGQLYNRKAGVRELLHRVKAPLKTTVQKESRGAGGGMETGPHFKRKAGAKGVE